jgi:hypothetical protein
MPVPGAPPAGRFLVAFDTAGLGPFVWAPTWTRLDSTANLVTSYQIDRGRQYELDRTDVGRATVQIKDTQGILDPTNPSGPHYGHLEPLLQAMIGRYNPVDSTWYTRYRGFIEDYDYSFDPSQRVNMLTITLVDLFEMVAGIEMHDKNPDGTLYFSDPDPTSTRKPATLGQVWFNNVNASGGTPQTAGDRITNILERSLLPASYYVVFSGNVQLQDAVYTPGESPMTAIQEVADAEFPGVSNVYVDRFGRLVFHGRYAKFNPSGVLAGTDNWDWSHLYAGDGAAVAAAPSTTAHLREFAFNRGLSKVINQAFATPSRAASGVDLTAAEIQGQLFTSPTSIGLYGIRAWTAENLLTKMHIGGSSDDLTETLRFSKYYVANYADPRNRVTACGFRSIATTAVGAGANWHLLSKVDISDRVDITVASPGGGGFGGTSDLDAQFYVEGVHETVQPLNPTMDDVTLTLDLSPVAFFNDTSMFPDTGP